MKILLSSTTTLSGLFLDNNGRHLGSLSFVTTLKSHADDNYQDYKWLESESENEMSDQSINQQVIKIFIYFFASFFDSCKIEVFHLSFRILKIHFNELGIFVRSIIKLRV